MSAALDLRNDLRNDPRYLRELLADARAALVDADASNVLLLSIVRTLVGRARPVDVEAEQRILGALLLGRATPADVASLRRDDFEGPGHELLFAVLSSVAELEAEREGRVNESGPPTRWRRARRARAVLRMYDPAAVDALDRLPWPGACPTECIAEVRALARWRRGQTS